LLESWSSNTALEQYLSISHDAMARLELALCPTYAGNAFRDGDVALQLGIGFVRGGVPVLPRFLQHSAWPLLFFFGLYATRFRRQPGVGLQPAGSSPAVSAFRRPNRHLVVALVFAKNLVRFDIRRQYASRN
jgi:hypothetical protein